MPVTIADNTQILVEIGFSTTAGSNLVPINSTLSAINWTDVSSYVRSVETQRGRSTELDTFQTGSCAVVLDNRTRIFDTEYGPAAVTLSGASGNHLSTPSAAAWNSTADFDIKVRCAPTSWASGASQALISKKSGAGADQYAFYITGTGLLRWIFSTNGTALTTVDSSVPVSFSNGAGGWVRVTRKQSTGVVTFYTAPDTPYPPNTWTQLGTTTTSSTSAYYSGATAVSIGSEAAGTASLFAGKMYRVTFSSTINGAATRDFDATRITSTSATTISSATGETYTVNTSGSPGTTLTLGGAYFGVLTPGRPIRITATPPSGSATRIFFGFIDTWTQAYEPPRDAITVVNASDAFKILNLITLPSYWEYDTRALSPTKWYRFDDGTAPTVAFDSINLTSDAFWYNSLNVQSTGASTTSLVSGDSSVSASFDGTKWVRMPDQALLHDSVNYLNHTVEFWMSTTTTTAGNYALLNLGAYEYTVACGMVVDGSGNGTIQAQWGSIAGVSNVQIYSSAIKVNDGRPHHVVMTWDWATSANSGVWVDGVRTNTYVTALTIAVGPSASFAYPFSRFLSSTYNFTNYFTGTIDELTFWQNTTLTSTQIGNRYQIGQGTYLSGQSTSSRISTILTMIGWMSDASNLTTGISTCQAINTQGKSALSLLQECEAAEQGRLFMGADGRLAFISRSALGTVSTYAVSQRTYGDGAGELPYRDIGLVYNDRLVRNRISVSRNNGATATVNDTDSQASYFIRSDSISGLINDTDTVVADIARARLSIYAQPSLRIETMALTPRASASTLYTPLIGDEIGTRITVKRRPQGIGTAISKELALEGISHSIGPKTWETTYNLSPVVNVINFILDSSTYGVLNQNILGY